MSDGYLQCHIQTNNVADSRDLHVSKLCISSKRVKLHISIEIDLQAMYL